MSGQRLSVVVLLALGAVLLPWPSMAWDDAGHEVVAQIACDTLAKESPATKQKLDDIIQSDPRPMRHNLLVCAIWPDLNKHHNEVPNAPAALFRSAPVIGNWHYVDIPYSMTDRQQILNLINMPGVKPDPRHPKHSGNVVVAIRYYAAKLQAAEKSGSDATAQDRADYLSWVIHFVGDVHQPLHCVTVTSPLPNYTPPSRGDVGGNGFVIKGMGRIRELHAFWDDQMDLTDRMKGRKEKHLHPDAERIEAQAHQLEQDYPQSRFRAELKKTDPAQWALESFSYRHEVYDLTPETRPGSDYQAFAAKTSDERITLAGYRLAQLLESVLK